MFLKFSNVFNKNFSIKRLFKRFFSAVFLLIILMCLISALIVLNLFSFLTISEKYSNFVYEVIVNSFKKI